MFERVLPQRADNASYRGSKAALWLLALVIFLKCAIGLGTIVNGRAAAKDADGIPIDTFSAAGEQAFVSLFAAWGVAQVTINLVGVLVLVRYRALVPLVFMLLLVEHLARKLVFEILPMPKVATATGTYINLALVAVMTAGLLLSLWRRRGATEARA